eukprot:6089257-Amphidinium_carterae.1
MRLYISPSSRIKYITIATAKYITAVIMSVPTVTNETFDKRLSPKRSRTVFPERLRMWRTEKGHAKGNAHKEIQLPQNREVQHDQKGRQSQEKV